MEYIPIDIEKDFGLIDGNPGFLEWRPIVIKDIEESGIDGGSVIITRGYTI